MYLSNNMLFELIREYPSEQLHIKSSYTLTFDHLTEQHIDNLYIRIDMWFLKGWTNLLYFEPMAHLGMIDLTWFWRPVYHTTLSSWLIQHDKKENYICPFFQIYNTGLLLWAFSIMLIFGQRRWYFTNVLVCYLWCRINLNRRSSSYLLRVQHLLLGRM